MTEDQIERQVERAMDRLDRKLMNGQISQEEYEKQVVTINLWAEKEYKDARNAR